MERVIFQNENFQFIEYSTCINNAVHQGLRVRSIGKAEEYMIEIKLNSELLIYDDTLVEHKYLDAIVEQTCSLNSTLTSEQAKECRETLEDSIVFAMYINSWLDENSEYKA
mgnify:CR=1 FL=1